MTVMMRYVCRPALCLCAAAVLLSGCKIGKHYTRPDLELPQTLTMDGMVEDSASMADYPWEQVYPDTLLQGLIRQMLDYNKDLLMADATVREQAALKRIDLANLLPQIGLRVYAERERENYGGDSYSNSDQFDLKGTVQWELDLWGKLRWAREASLADFLGSVENRRALQMSLVAQVAQTYFELVALDNELNIVRQTVDARRESLRLARLRNEGGLTSEVPVRQAQVELARTETRQAAAGGRLPRRAARGPAQQAAGAPPRCPPGRAGAHRRQCRGGRGADQPVSEPDAERAGGGGE